MKKITSIFSLGLLLSTSILLGSCGECESGPGCDGPGASSATVEELKQKVAEQADQLAALSSEVANVPYTISQDADGNIWLENPTSGQKQPITAGLKGPKGDPGKDGTTVTISDDKYWVINGTKTTVKAEGQDGKTPTISIIDGYWAIDGVKTTTQAQGPKGDTGNSGTKDNNGVYVKYGDNPADVIYIPEVSQDDNNVYIKVGATTYQLPRKSGSGCTCTWALTNNNDGTYTLTNGKTGTEESTVTIPVWDDVKWIKDVKVIENQDGTFTVSNKDGSNSITIPAGSDADVKVENGVATVTSKDGQTSIKLQELQPVVSTDGGYVKVVNYNFAGNKVDSVYLPTKGQLETLTQEVYNISTKLDSVAQAGQEMKETLDSLSKAVSDLEKELTDKINELLNNVFNSIAKSITNIQVEEVMSNAIGSYNGVLSNLKTTKLVGYYGTTDEIIFPKHEPLFYKAAGDPAMTNILGEIQLTVNPIGTDFSGVSVSLVNSLGQESSIKLSDLKSSDKLLMTGLTRADGTGLYTTTATVDAANLEDPRLHIAVDKSAVKEAVKAAWHDLKEVYNQRRLGAVQGETVNKIANAVYNVVNGISTERLAVKTTYKDSVQNVSGDWVRTEKSIVSPYDLSGIAVKPLGFESLPEQYRDSIRVFKKAKKAIKKLNTRIAKKIIRTINKEADLNNIDKQIKDLQIKIAKVKPIPDSMKVLKQVVSIDTTVTVKVPIDKTITLDINKDIFINVPVEVTYEIPGNFEVVPDPTSASGYRITYDPKADTGKASTVVKDTINFVYTKDVRIQQDIETNVRFWIEKEFTFDISDMVDQVNNALDVVTSVDGLCTSAQKIINNIYKYENKLLAGTYLNRIYKLIDKASAYSAQGIYKLFQPVLLINSEKGFGFAGIRGVPATVSGTVEVIPTTYSNGLVAPVYKRYIKVNDNPGHLLEEGQVSLDITSELVSGENIVQYYAVDYYGNEWGGTNEVGDNEGTYLIIKE